MLLALVTLSFLVAAGLLAFLLDSLFGKLDFSSSAETAGLVIDILKQRRREKGNFVDLGSCRGGLAIKIARSLPDLQVLGIDDSWFRIWLATTRSLFLKNLKFKKGDIFDTDVFLVDVAYIYLPQELMPDLQTKLQKELKPGALVLSASVSFPSWQPAQVYDLNQEGLKVPKLFVYVKN